MYVADKHNSCISVFYTDGVFHQAIGREQLNYPCDVAVTSSDELLVVDEGHNCIYKFTLDGCYVDKFINHAVELHQPTSIAIDPNDFVFVTDAYNHRVVIFDLFGNLVHKFGSEGSGEGEFSYPHGIAVNKNGKIYVTDSDNERIQIFSI